MSLASPKTSVGGERGNFWKTVLRTACILLAFTSIVMLAWTTQHEPHPTLTGDFTKDSPTYRAIVARGTSKFLAWSFITLGLSFIWNSFNAIVAFFTSRESSKRGGNTHISITNIVLECLLWTTLTITTAIAAFGGARWVSGRMGQGFISPNAGPIDYFIVDDPSKGTHTIHFTNGTEVVTTDLHCFPFADCTAQDGYSKEFVKLGGVVIAAVVLMVILILSHFTFFVAGWRSRHLERKGRTMLM